jgi:hypothetical protein
LAALKGTVDVVEIWREGRQSGALESGEAKSFGRKLDNSIWLLFSRSASSHKPLFGFKCGASFRAAPPLDSR